MPWVPSARMGQASSHCTSSAISIFGVFRGKGISHQCAGRSCPASSREKVKALPRCRSSLGMLREAGRTVLAGGQCEPSQRVQWDEADAQLAHSLRLLTEGHSRLEAARTRVAWGTVSRGRGDLAAQSCWRQLPRNQRNAPMVTVQLSKSAHRGAARRARQTR